MQREPDKGWTYYRNRANRYLYHITQQLKSVDAEVVSASSGSDLLEMGSAVLQTDQEQLSDQSFFALYRYVLIQLVKNVTDEAVEEAARVDHPPGVETLPTLLRDANNFLDTAPEPWPSEK